MLLRYEEVVRGENYVEFPTYYEGVPAHSLGVPRTARDLKAFVESVELNGGYYIARYEASYGTDEKPNSKVSIGFLSDRDIPLTQEGYLWNNINQINAAEKCENIYSTVKSDLVNSYAWDTAIVYIQKFSGVGDYSQQDGESINDQMANTGKINDEVCKINDLASNLNEWTTEVNLEYEGTISEDVPCITRGGTYYWDDMECCYRDANYAADEESDRVVIRPILYLSNSN